MPSASVASAPVAPVDWETYLGQLDSLTTEAEAALSRGEVFTWPDLPLPTDRPSPEQRRRATRIQDRMTAVLDLARMHRGTLAKELSRLATVGSPKHRSTGALGGTFDISG